MKKTPKKRDKGLKIDKEWLKRRRKTLGKGRDLYALLFAAM